LNPRKKFRLLTQIRATVSFDGAALSLLKSSDHLIVTADLIQRFIVVLDHIWHTMTENSTRQSRTWALSKNNVCIIREKSITRMPMLTDDIALFFALH
jgi:hypothetical protein